MPDQSTSLVVAGEKFYPLLRAHGIEPFEYMGRPAFMPRQVSTALGYATPKIMLAWLSSAEGTSAGTHWGVLTGADLDQVKGLEVADLVGGRTSWRETILFLPGLMYVLVESRMARSNKTLGSAFRGWLCREYLPAWRLAGGVSMEEMLEMIASGNYPKSVPVREAERAAPIVEPPKQLAGPVELLKEALRLDREVVSKSCGAAWLRDQARTAEARARYAKERAAEEMRRALAEDRRIMREARERRKQAAKRPVKTTLW